MNLETAIMVCAHEDRERIALLEKQVAHMEAERTRWRHRALKLKAGLCGAAQTFDMFADDTEHDCGNHDGGSPESCEACQYREVAKHYWDIINGNE